MCHFNIKHIGEIFMDKTVVIFESKYGSTKQYANWIAETLSCPLSERKAFRPQDFAQYETIIYGGGLYAGGVSGINLLIQNWNLICRKRIVLFTCGIADPNDPENVSHIRSSLSKSLPPEMMERIHIFHLRGGINYPRLSLVHRAMMFMLRKMMLKKRLDSLRQEDRLFLDTYGKSIDFTNQESIQPLINFVLN